MLTFNELEKGSTSPTPQHEDQVRAADMPRGVILTTSALTSSGVVNRAKAC
jgi:hypothetical protein